MFGGIVTSPRGTLSPLQALELAMVYLDNASATNDPDITLVFCHDTEVSLAQARRASKYIEDPSLRERIGAAYFNLGKLLHSRGHYNEAQASTKKAEKLGVHFQEQTSRPSNLGNMDPIDAIPDPATNLPIIKPSSRLSMSMQMQGGDIATLPLHVFARNARPPTITFKPPEPDARIDDTQQLTCCLSLLRASHDPDDILDLATRNWLQLTKADTDEQERLKGLATDVIRAFKRDELRDSKTVAEVAYLAPVLDKDDFRYLVKEFHSGIKQSALLDIHQLEGLAQLLQGSEPGYLEADDLIKILELLNTRLLDTHHQSPHLIYKLTLTISHVLDAMADANVKDLDRESLHEPLSLYLDKLKDSTDAYLVYQAAYAYQALLCVPDNETLWQAAMRRSSKIIKGVSGLVSAVKGLDLNGFMEGLKDIQQGLDGVSSIAQFVKSTYEGVVSLEEGGRGFMNCLEECLSFNRKCAWYPALRGADALIRDGQLAKLRKLICEAPCRRDPAFQWGVCQRLGDIASNPMWDAETRRSAIGFLGEMYQNDAMWGHQPTVKQWILNILMQLSSFHMDEIQFAETILPELGVNGDASKQALYRACQENGPGSHPLKIALPALASPSLLDRVQNRLDVEGNIRLLRRQRSKERGNPVYIPPQAKASLQAPDSARFPLMETVKDFVTSPRQVFLLLGESGAGKSTFNHELEYELWKMYKKKTGAIPLYINLPAIDKPEHDMIAKQLRKAEFTEPQIRELKLHRKFFIICDGYDESQETHNLYTSNRLNQTGEWNAKMVISCRSEYIGVDYRDRFRPGDRNHRADTGLFQEAVITPFALNQVQDYISQYVSVHQPLWGVKEYTEALDHIPSLKELVKNPFLMTLSLEVLPRMVDPGQGTSATRVTNLTRVALYDQFIEHWLERGKKRLGEKNLSPQARTAFESLIDEGFTRSGVNFLKRLCAAIYQEQDGQPIVRYSRYNDEGSWKTAFFSRDDENQLLREACPLTRSGNQHRFIHRTLLEYGLALAIFDPQDLKATMMTIPRLSRRLSVDSNVSIDVHEPKEDAPVTAIPGPDFNSPLVWRSFVNEPSVLLFLEERVHQEPVFKQQLFDYIEHSKVDLRWRIAAANAITILVRAGIQFNYADLRGVRIPRADLSYGIFEAVQLQEADLRHVNLRGTLLQKANLDKAHMIGAQFGELPYLTLDSIVKSSAYSPDGKTFTVGLDGGKINVYSTSNWEARWTSGVHSGDIFSISYSPNSCQVASGSKDKTVRIWETESGICCFMLIGHTSDVNWVDFSPLGDIIASASDDSTIRLWDANTGDCRRILTGHLNIVSRIVFSPKGNQLASCSGDTTVRLWDIETGVCAHTLTGHSEWVSGAVYSPQGDRLASTSYDATSRLWDVRTGECLQVLTGHSDYIFSSAFSPRGNQLATASKDRTVRLWDVQTGLCRHILADHNGGVFMAVFSPQGDQIATASSDATVRLWDPEAGVCCHSLSGHTRGISSVLYSPKGDQVASCSVDKTVRLWDVKIGSSRHLSSSHNSSVWCVQHSPRKGQAASCSMDGTIRLWDVEAGTSLRILAGHSDYVYWIAYAPTGDQIASAGYDRTVKVWNVDTGECSKTLTGHTESVLRVVYSPSGNQIASCSGDTTVRLWDVETGVCTHTLEGHSDAVLIVVYPQHGGQVASASEDMTVRIWDVETGECLHILTGHSDSVYCAAYSPEGDQLASSSADETVRLWDVQTGSRQHILSNHSEEVSSIVYSPRGNQLATASDDKTVRLWDTKTGVCNHVLTGHSGTVRKIVYSPHGDMVVSTGADTSLRLWDTASGQCRAVIQDVQDRVFSIDWSTSFDSKYVMTGSRDGSVKMWEVVKDEDHCDMRLIWRSTKGGLDMRSASIQDIRGLSQLNRQLLKQRGATGEPGNRLHKSDKRTNVVSPLKSTVDNPSPVASTSVDQADKPVNQVQESHL